MGRGGKESTWKRRIIWSRFSECHPVKSSSITVVAVSGVAQALLQSGNGCWWLTIKPQPGICAQKKGAALAKLQLHLGLVRHRGTKIWAPGLTLGYFWRATPASVVPHSTGRDLDVNIPAQFLQTTNSIFLFPSLPKFVFPKSSPLNTSDSKPISWKAARIY